MSFGRILQILARCCKEKAGRIGIAEKVWLTKIQRDNSTVRSIQWQSEAGLVTIESFQAFQRSSDWGLRMTSAVRSPCSRASVFHMLARLFFTCTISAKVLTCDRHWIRIQNNKCCPYSNFTLNLQCHQPAPTEFRWSFFSHLFLATPNVFKSLIYRNFSLKEAFSCTISPCQQPRQSGI